MSKRKSNALKAIPLRQSEPASTEDTMQNSLSDQVARMTNTSADEEKKVEVAHHPIVEKTKDRWYIRAVHEIGFCRAGYRFSKHEDIVLDPTKLDGQQKDGIEIAVSRKVLRRRIDRGQ